LDIEQIKLNSQQIQNTLKFIHDTQSEDVKRCIFSELGRQCFFATGTAGRMEKYRGRPGEYLRRVNDDRAVPYWESILPGGDGNSYILTGVKVDRCVCAYADGGDAPQSLCDHCCREFQKQFFSMLFDRETDIEISESYLKGDNRCSTIIRFL
jgi:hypothetical protein